MDFKKHMVSAWELTLKYIVSLVLMTLVMVGVSFVTLGILAPVMMAGYMQSILLMMRDGREPKIQDLFSQMGLFLPLFAFGVIVFIAVIVGFMLLVIPGFLVIIAVSFCCLYMLPLMTDKKLGLVEAIKESYAMAVKNNISEHIVVAILFLAIVGIGGSFFIGLLFTQPLATIFLLSVYEEKVGSSSLTP
jgi:membrane-anchored glycerophosphoryl diester phosphodiesterase (GDPDase)